MYETNKETATKDLKNTAENVKDSVREGANKAKAEVTDFAAKTGRSAHNALDKAGNGIANARDAVTDTINGNPIPATGVALLAGLAIGFLIARR